MLSAGPSGDFGIRQERFETAAKEASDKEGPLKGVTTSNDEKLKMYALYKQVGIFSQSYAVSFFVFIEVISPIRNRELLVTSIPLGLECWILPERYCHEQLIRAAYGCKKVLTQILSQAKWDAWNNMKGKISNRTLKIVAL